MTYKSTSLTRQLYVEGAVVLSNTTMILMFSDYDVFPHILTDDNIQKGHLSILTKWTISCNLCWDLSHEWPLVVFKIVDQWSCNFCNGPKAVMCNSIESGYCFCSSVDYNQGILCDVPLGWCFYCSKDVLINTVVALSLLCDAQCS